VRNIFFWQKKIFLAEEDIPYRRRYSPQKKIFLTEEDIPYRRRYSSQKKIFLTEEDIQGISSSLRNIFFCEEYLLL
jgi:hypothetical protein